MARATRKKQAVNAHGASAKVGDWPADRVVRMKVDALVPYARNPRLHTPEQVEQLAEAIRRFGFTNPVIVDEHGEIIAGHGRVMAARRLGLMDVPAVAIAPGEWTEDDKRAYRIWDNQSALLSEWDHGLLKVELTDLKLSDYDLNLTGFDTGSLVSFMAFGGAGGKSDPEVTPEPPVAPVTLPGDRWEMGAHRLLCGDCTSADDVARLLGKQRPHLMVTDPPYGVNYDPSWRLAAVTPGRRANPNGTPVQFNFQSTGTVTNDKITDWSSAWSLFEGDVAYVWSPGGPLQIVSHDALLSVGLEPRYQIIWNKPHFALGRGDYHWQHEPCWYAVRKNARSHWCGDRSQATVWTIQNGCGWTTKKEGPDARTGHGTQKPVECMKRPIENNSQPGDLVYDPFLGSGTTLIAAEMTGRACLAMDIDPIYVDVAVRRWETFTGHKAVLAGTDKTFDEISRERTTTEA